MMEVVPPADSPLPVEKSQMANGSRCLISKLPVTSQYVPGGADLHPHVTPKVFRTHKFGQNPMPGETLGDGFNPFEKYSSNWIISPNFRGEHKKCLSCHHLGFDDSRIKSNFG